MFAYLYLIAMYLFFYSVIARILSVTPSVSTVVSRIPLQGQQSISNTAQRNVLDDDTHLI